MSGLRILCPRLVDQLKSNSPGAHRPSGPALPGSPSDLGEVSVVWLNYAASMALSLFFEIELMGIFSIIKSTKLYVFPGNAD